LREAGGGLYLAKGGQSGAGCETAEDASTGRLKGKRVCSRRVGGEAALRLRYELGGAPSKRAGFRRIVSQYSSGTIFRFRFLKEIPKGSWAIDMAVYIA
jgi:hypothetical protein